MYAIFLLILKHLRPVTTSLFGFLFPFQVLFCCLSFICNFDTRRSSFMNYACTFSEDQEDSCSMNPFLFDPAAYPQPIDVTCHYHCLFKQKGASFNSLKDTDTHKVLNSNAVNFK